MVNHMRHTRGHTRNRRSHHALTGVGSILCASCGQPKLKHVACSNCGLYKGNDALGM
ncbi:MAG TPA: 50S ribosomal protein L32, partial [Candidatus Paceibacterota bacterium]